MADRKLKKGDVLTLNSEFNVRIRSIIGSQAYCQLLHPWDGMSGFVSLALLGQAAARKSKKKTTAAGPRARAKVKVMR
jgi:hypothetical protein